MLIDALSDPARMNREDDGRQLSGHGIVIVIGNYIVSTCFTSKVGPRHATATLTIPVETVSPPFVFVGGRFVVTVLLYSKTFRVWIQGQKKATVRFKPSSRETWGV